MLLPQRWDGANLIANLVLLPNGDPTAPVPITGGQELPFAAAQPVLRAALLSGFATPPWAPAIPPASIARIPFALPYSGTEGPIYSQIKADYTPSIPAGAQSAGAIRKDLPPSYLEATGFQVPDSPNFTAIDGFGCALGTATPSTTPVTARPIAWGEIVSFAIRQPLIAQAMGLMYLGVTIPIAPALVKSGGWIWLEIDTSNSSNWYAGLVGQKASAVAAYAARLPQLTGPRDVFAAVLFPTVSANYDSALLDAAQLEADLYLDGFAKIVHANQPTSSDAVTGDSTAIVPGCDAGIQIGWDDVQVTTWVNRQIQIAQALASPMPPATPVAELPFTVLGYRVDVRQSDSGPWSSLCNAQGTLNAAGVFSTPYSAELAIEPTPVQNAGPNQAYWLPRYFAQWRGRSLVADDRYAYSFSGGQPPANTYSNGDFSGTSLEVLSGVSLRFGRSYQFRTRLADLSGGGPASGDPDPSDEGVASIAFRRYVPPKQAPFSLGAPDAFGNRTLTVDRPAINYPEMVFTGAADQNVLDQLLAITPPQPPAGTAPPHGAPPFQAAVLDSDVQTLQIVVEAQAPLHDTGTPANLTDASEPPSPGELDGVFRVVYTTNVAYPAISTPVDISASTPIYLTLQPVETASIAGLAPSPATPTILPVPTGRDLRIRLRGVGAPDPNGLYYGNAAARTGLTGDFRVRFESAAESHVIAAGSPDRQLQAFYLRDLNDSGGQAIVLQSIAAAVHALPAGSQALTMLQTAVAPPASTPLQLLASALNLPLAGQTITAPPGRRILFGAQSTLRHTIPQDGSSIEFSTQKDLINHWIVVQRLTLNRDWTWRGLAQNGPGQLAFSFRGASYPQGGSTPPLDALGTINLPAVVSSLATRQNGEPIDRDSTELIFFSTIDSAPASNGFPAPSSATYRLLATLTGNPASPLDLWDGDITVPITAQPRQVPRLVSAGIAESPYVAAPDYSSTSQRERALWLEFDRPPDDPGDSYFIRVMNYGPDPLLVSVPTDRPPAQDAPIALDPEPIRQITPDSVNDDAGLAAMTRVIPSGSSPVHFLVPLPDGVPPSALDLFGFWTYEIRCGHYGFWSTAQGRFGAPLRVAGVQHPCPPLTANVDRSVTVPSAGGTAQPCIVCSADLAQTVYNGESLTAPNNPQTSIYFLLYAQLRRADGGACRNILLGKLLGAPPQTAAGALYVKRQQYSIPVRAAFAQAAVEKILAGLHLPANTPLSVLAVELFNAESQVIRGDRKPVLNVQAVAAAPDPLGAQLGSRRILRTSPLTPVRAIC
ncbi:MAG: hypothetical protein KGN84_17735 [Acidobacteriota bacterium]|nr:hypothetical protein [Acidobacteriota bacterium]